jgi:hypothetical protein
MSDAEPQSSPPPESSPPRAGRGGRRLGAGRPRKARPGTSANLDDVSAPARPVPTVGSVVLFWDSIADGTRWSFVARPAIVLEADEPGDPESPLTLAVFDLPRRSVDFLYGVPAALRPGEEGGWSWPS